MVNKMESNKIKIIGLILLVLSSIFIAGCEFEESSDKQINRQIEDNVQTLMLNQPAIRITKSLERENLNDRANVLNDDSKVFYVYLMSYGKVVAFFTAKSKVSSLNSYLNPQEKPYNAYVNCPTCMHEFTVDTPDIDGSYGKNADGVFFFTTDGAYVEWTGEYLASDFPLKITTPLELTREIK